MSSITTEIVRLRIDRLATSRGRIRPLLDRDLDQICALSIKNGRKAADEVLLKRLLFESPWRDNGVGSLVYEDATGQLLGLLGLSARPMLFRGRPIRAVVGHHFLIDPSRGGARAGIELVRRFLNGSQDLSLAVWNDIGRRVWTSLGGSVNTFHSLSWTRALRPAQYVLGMLRSRGLPAAAAVPLYPAFQALDATLTILRKRPVASRPADALTDDLDAVTMLSYLSAFASDRALRPHYDIASLTWLLETLADGGGLHKVAVKTPSGRPLGWYIYHLGVSAAAEVLQIGGRDDALRDVVDHLFDHAKNRGAVAVTGPIDARLVGALSEKNCTFHRPRNTWMLFHSHDPRMAEAIHAGDAFLSRLEGAFWTEIDS